MAMGLTPAMAYATPENDAGGGVTLSSSAPTAKGSEFYANGTPIKITAKAPEDGKPARFDEFNAGGDSAFISWEQDGSTMYVGVGESVFVFGGSDGSDSPASVESTQIDMTGGKIARIYGGNRGSQTNGVESCSKVIGDVVVSLSDDAVVTDMVVGGGRYNASVAGQVNMDFDGVDLSDESNKCYVMGGVHGDGSEGTRNIDEGKMETAAVVGSVRINAQNSNFYLITAGGGGSTKVNYADVYLRGESSSGSVYAGGINGEVVESHIRIEGSNVGEFAATNRGFVGTCNFDAKSAEIGNLYMGATPGCFGSDSGGHDGSGVTGESHWNVDDNTTVKNAVLTPLVKRDGSNYSSIVNTTSITKSGDLMNVSLEGFSPVTGVTLEKTVIPENSSLALSNVNLSVKESHTLANAGHIEAVEGGSVKVESGATLENAGTIEANVDAEEGAVFNQCAARLGSTGYATLQAAVNAAADGVDGENRVTLLKSVNEDIDIPATKRISLDLNGFTLTNDSGHTITNNGMLTVVDNGGTGVVDNVTHGKAALWNEVGAIAILNAGTFIRTKESGSSSTENGVNSYYAILNHGMMTINDGVSVVQNGNYSSLLENGWQDGSKNKTKEKSQLIINGGTFTGGLNTIKNDDYGHIWINRGTFENIAQAAVLNWNVAVINGGTFNSNDRVVLNGYLNDTMDQGKLTINGGTFNPAEGSDIIQKMGGSNNAGNIKISGGTFNGKLAAGSIDATSFVVTGGVIKASDENKKAIPYFIADDDAAKVDSGMLKIVDRINLGAGEYIVADGAPDITAAELADGLEVVENEDGTFTVVEPDRPVTPPAKPSYDVTVDQPENGTVELSAKTAKEGQKVIVTVKPDEGFELASLVVADEDGNALKLELSADGTYSFEMPAGDVTVHAAFECDGGELCPSHGFTDVDQSQWYHAAIDWAVEAKVLNGIDGTTLMMPDAEITRAQMAQVLWNVEGNEPAASEAAFSDVDPGEWYVGAISWAVESGVFEGYAGTSLFGPDEPLTREQASLVLQRWSELNGEDVSGRADLSVYPDAELVSDWALDGVSWAVSAGILKGVDQEDGTALLDPAGTATRAQVAALMMRLEGQRTA